MIFSEYRQQYNFIENNQIKSIGLKELMYKFDYTNSFIIGTNENISNRNMPQLKQFIIEKLENPLESFSDFITAKHNVEKWDYKIINIFVSPKNYLFLTKYIEQQINNQEKQYYDLSVIDRYNLPQRLYLYNLNIYYTSELTDLEIKFELDTYI
jgi:hypothetical protein